MHINFNLGLIRRMDKDRSKKKRDTLWKQVKRNTAKQFQYWKPKTQGKDRKL